MQAHGPEELGLHLSSHAEFKWWLRLFMRVSKCSVCKYFVKIGRRDR